jgi:1-acyl-sn-glycerol-3-phosphate acyltransferase
VRAPSFRARFALIGDTAVVRTRSAGQWLRIVFAGASFVGFGLGAVVLGSFVLPMASAFTRGPERRERRCQRIVQAAFRLFHDFMRITGLVDWNPRSSALCLPDHPVVVVANHPTLVDISALVSLFGPICYLAKRSLFRNPLLGPLLRCCGQIPGGGATLHDNVKVIDEAIERLARGHSLLLFPEGTRSPPGGMHPFHAGAFEIARRARVPILPVVVRANPPGLYRGLAWYQIPSRAIRLEVELLPELDPVGTASTREVRTGVQEAIRARLG